METFWRRRNGRQRKSQFESWIVHERQGFAKELVGRKLSKNFGWEAGIRRHSRCAEGHIEMPLQGFELGASLFSNLVRARDFWF
jgi:hypothetical protein